MGVGIIIRDHNGNFLSACRQLLDEVTSPEIAEALAIRHAVTLTRDEDLDRIILVSDCLSVIQRIGSPHRDRSLVGVIMEDIVTTPGSTPIELFVLFFLCINMHHNIKHHACFATIKLFY
jgi:hypothetical protein